MSVLAAVSEYRADADVEDGEQVRRAVAIVAMGQLPRPPRAHVQNPCVGPGPGPESSVEAEHAWSAPAGRGAAATSTSPTGRKSTALRQSRTGAPPRLVSSHAAT